MTGGYYARPFCWAIDGQLFKITQRLVSGGRLFGHGLAGGLGDFAHRLPAGFAASVRSSEFVSVSVYLFKFVYAFYTG